MKKIRDLVRVKETIGLYGVEIEVEGKSLPNHFPHTWRVEEDGSLKAEEAHEYVMTMPDSLEGVRRALDLMQLAYDECKSEVDESIRAGVHVHMNVQEWNMKDLMTFVMVYYILEDILMEWCGPNREGNLFCLRTRDAEYVLFRLIKTLRTQDIKLMNDEIIRYSSLNFCSMFRYGSIEFRGMRSTGDLNTIFNWVKIIDDMATASRKFSSPVDVLASMSGEGGLSFFEAMLPNTHHLFNKETIEERVREAARRVQIVAYSTDWDSLEVPNINPFIQKGF